MPGSGPTRHVRSVAHVVTELLGANDPSTRDRVETSFLHEAIARAKQEWECTVDALPELVCVLDGQRNVLRANRTMECWSLGRVNEVQGRSLHEMLHAGCNDSPCALALRLEASWLDMLREGTSHFEQHDARLGRALSATLRRVPSGGPYQGARQIDLAVIVLSDVTQLLSIQADLRQLNEQLEARIEARTSELNASRAELSRLSGQLMSAQEDDRRRIAQELHDSIGQSLGAIKYSLERAVQMNRAQDIHSQQSLLRSTITRVQQTIESARSIAAHLRPSILDDLGAVSAVRWFCREFGEVYTHIKIHTAISATDADIPEKLGTPIFRFVQEALNNVAQHARAKNVFVSILCDDSSLTLEVRDDGIGFDLSQIHEFSGSGLGLSGLRERAAKSGGKFLLRSKRRSGTVVRVGWPLRPNVVTFAADKQKGFTLLELLVVMVIIGILAGFVAPRYFAQVGKSQVRAASAQIDALDKALDQYRIDMDRYPSSEEGLDALTNAPPNDPAWTGPYLKKAVPLDPWGHPYVYVSPGSHGDVDILSFGKDGQPGGSGENADISNW